MLRSHPGLTLRRSVLAVVTFLPVALVYAILYHRAVGIPCLDDYNAVLNFLLVQRAAPGLLEKLRDVIAFQHAEYKLIFEHALFAVWFAVRGSFSFRVFLTLGNLLLLPMLGAFWLMTRRPDEAEMWQRLTLFLPVPWLLLQLTYAELLNWTMASLSALAVVVFAAGCLALLFRPGRGAAAGSMLLAALACASSGNGFLLLPAGLLGLLLLRRRWQMLLLWTLPFVCVLPLYLFHYSAVDHGASPPLAEQVLFFFEFLGGAIENMHGVPVHHGSALVGVLLFGGLLYAMYTRVWERVPALFAMAVWVVLSAMVVAHVRSSISTAQALSGRYKIYSAVLLVFSYVLLLDQMTCSRPGAWVRRRQRPLLVTVAALAMAFSVAGDIVGERVLARRELNLNEGMQRYLADPTRSSPLYAPTDPQDFSAADYRFEQETLTAAIRAGIYRPPASTKAGDMARPRR